MRRRVVMLLAVLVMAPSFVLGSGEREGAPQRLLVRFDGELPALDGMSVLYRFRSIAAAYVEATPAAALDLGRAPGVTYVELPSELGYHLETATLASRARDVWDEVASPETPTLRNATGDVIDGSGVGIAVVDGGFDGTHPDLAFARHFVVYADGVAEAPYSAATTPHGTHVAGIVAGSGNASRGLRMGAAPGASMYAFAIGLSGNIDYPAIAFDWILENGEDVEPPIRVVTNSWGCRSTTCRAINGQLHVELASLMAERGIVVLFSAGNDGGDGSVSEIGPEATNPTPGVISVANYDDLNSTTREGCIHISSSRGASYDPLTWPDVAGPGARIMSASATGTDPIAMADGYVPDPTNPYRSMTGTSMSTPHVAGIAALMLQANPTLAPREVEYILKSTATKLDCGVAHPRADPAHAYDGANYEEGHGLVDAYAAVEAAADFAGIPPMPPAEPVPPEFFPVLSGVAPTRMMYFQGEGFTSTRPTGDDAQVTTRFLEQSVSRTSAPLASSVTFGGTVVDAWIGTSGELIYTRIAPPLIVATVESVSPLGSVTTVSATTAELLLGIPGIAVQREMVAKLDAPVTVPAGHRLRVTIEVQRGDLNPLLPDQTVAWALHDGAAATPSRLELGTLVSPVPPGSDLECQAQGLRCARIDADHPSTPLECERPYAYRVAWTGPGGSSASLVCNGAVAQCEVEGGAPGSCEGEGTALGVDENQAAICSASTTAPWSGQGRCARVGVSPLWP